MVRITTVEKKKDCGRTDVIALELFIGIKNNIQHLESNGQKSILVFVLDMLNNRLEAMRDVKEELALVIFYVSFKKT